MNKFFILLVSVMLLSSIKASGQRPIWDTITFEEVDEYHFNASAANCSGGHGYYKYLCVNNTLLDHLWSAYLNVLRNSLNPGGQMSLDYFYQQYPELATGSTGRHITGQEYFAIEPMMVVGLAVCPTVVSDRESLLKLTASPLYTHYGEWVHVVDTTMASRLTEYVQLYTIEGGQPQFQAEGAWRWENPHRYMLFTNWYDVDYYRYSDRVHLYEDTTYVPLYEAMFDSGILLAGKSYMLAGTHNNNGAVWAEVCSDTTYSVPTICFEHSPTAYSCYIRNYTSHCMVNRWIKYDTLPWWNYNANHLCIDINIFPILDTLFGAPCAAVTRLQTVEVDSLWATLMWSADARHHAWEVAYRPADDSLASDRVVTVSVPTVMLTDLTPGTAYNVRVRGLCDIENYSPWSDTLQFVTTFTPYTPPDTTPDTVPYIRPHTLDLPSIGNLDRYTRIMPNPAHDVVNVLSSYQLKSVAVYDLTGRQLLEQPAEGLTTTVNVAALPRGTYILAIRTLQGTATKKLILK